MRKGTPPIATGVIAGVLLTPPALLLVIASGGAGHGDYGFARALFPVPMVIAGLAGRIGPVSIAFAVAQIPVVGGLAGWSFARQRAWPVIILLGVHLLATAFAFSGQPTAFS